MENIVALAFGALAFWAASRYRVDESVPGFGGPIVIYTFVAVLVVVGTRALMFRDYELGAFSLVAAGVLTGGAELLNVLNRRSKG